MAGKEMQHRFKTHYLNELRIRLNKTRNERAKLEGTAKTDLIDEKDSLIEDLTGKIAAAEQYFKARDNYAALKRPKEIPVTEYKKGDFDKSYTNMYAERIKDFEEKADILREHFKVDMPKLVADKIAECEKEIKEANVHLETAKDIIEMRRAYFKEHSLPGKVKAKIMDLAEKGYGGS